MVEPGLLGEDGTGMRYLQLGGREHGGLLFVETPEVRPSSADNRRYRFSKRYGVRKVRVGTGMCTMLLRKELPGSGNSR